MSQDLLIKETITAEIEADDHEASWYNRGNALINLGRNEEAINSFDKALEHRPDFQEAWYSRGISLGNIGDYEEAISSFDRVLVIKPDFYDAWVIRGAALGELGRHEEAIASYDLAIATNPDFHQAWYNRGVALRDLGRYEEAIASYDLAIATNPGFHQAWYNRGVALRDLGRYEEAIASYDLALAIKPDTQEAWNNRGIALFNLGRYEEAIASHDKALVIKPNKYEAWLLRGICQGKLDRKEQAIADFNQAKVLIKSIDPEDPELLQSLLPLLHQSEAATRSQLGAQYVSEGRWYDGLAQLQASLDYYRQIDNPERRADLLAQIARGHLLLGDWDKARMLYRDALRLYLHLGKKEGIANCHLALGRMMLQLNYIEDAQKELETARSLFDECGLSQRQTEAEEILEVISQFKSKQILKI